MKEAREVLDDGPAATVCISGRGHSDNPTVNVLCITYTFLLHQRANCRRRWRMLHIPRVCVPPDQLILVMFHIIIHMTVSLPEVYIKKHTLVKNLRSFLPPKLHVLCVHVPADHLLIVIFQFLCHAIFSRSNFYRKNFVLVNNFQYMIHSDVWINEKEIDTGFTTSDIVYPLFTCVCSLFDVYRKKHEVEDHLHQYDKLKHLKK